MNNFNTTGKADIIIKSFTDWSGGRKSFKKGQVITKLSNVDYNIEFYSQGKEVRAKTSLLNYTDFEPHKLQILNVNINRTLAEILYTEKFPKDYVAIISEDETQKSNENGIITLKEIPFGNIVVYDQFLNIVAAEINQEQGIISGLAENSLYFISYEVEKQLKNGYFLSKTNAPYVTIEIKNKNNYGTEGMNTFTLIEKASLELEPTLNFTELDITSLPLTFIIIGGKVKIFYY